MTHAIRIHKPGGPEVLVWEEIEVGKSGPGEARVRHTAVGVNFVDIYIRTGLYPVTRSVMPADRLVVLPDGVTDVQAAAMMLKGLTAQYLIRQIYKVHHTDTILFHAAAGGVGLIACQWAKSVGATAGRVDLKKGVNNER